MHIQQGRDYITQPILVGNEPRDAEGVKMVEPTLLELGYYFFRVPQRLASPFEPGSYRQVRGGSMRLLWQ